MQNTLSLSQLVRQIAEVLEDGLPDTYWVRVEISELNVRGGHCYMELVEKHPDGNSFAAKIRAVCWANVYAALRSYFEAETGIVLRAGLQVLVAVEVRFHIVYGLNVQVVNIEPSYTVGDMALQRRQTLVRLQTEGVMEMNKSLVLPVLPRRIAVISADTAAGYGDFCHQLDNNPYGFKLAYRLFPAIMQGERAVASIIAALEDVYEIVDDFDILVIVRGGGAATDLSCFDDFELALHIAQFPLPVITGIGHLRDLSVLDLVAHTCVKTPTAVAEFILDKFVAQLRLLEGYQQRLISIVDRYVQTHMQDLQSYSMRLRSLMDGYIMRQQNRLDYWNKAVELHSPERILRKGYTLTLLNGKPIVSLKELKKGMRITTEFAEGRIGSIVE